MKSRPLHGLAEEAVGSGIYLGAGLGGRAFTGPERSVLVLALPSGKTSSLVTPNILLWSGAVVTTSTKPDVLRATAPSRGERGWPLLYDPSGSVEPPRGVERVGWSPVNAAVEWDGALAVGSAMIGAARGHGRDIGSSGDHCPSEPHRCSRRCCTRRRSKRCRCRRCCPGWTVTTRAPPLRTRKRNWWQRAGNGRVGGNCRDRRA